MTRTVEGRLPASYLVGKVVEVFGITREQLEGPCRKRKLFYARVIAARLLLSRSKWSSQKAGLVLRRDYTTVIYYKRQFPILLWQDERFRDFYDEVLDRILNDNHIREMDRERQIKFEISTLEAERDRLRKFFPHCAANRQWRIDRLNDELRKISKG